MSADSEIEASPTTYLPISDQWLLIGLLSAGAILIDTSPLDLLRLPITLASFIAATPDTWIPLPILSALMIGALILERVHASTASVRVAWIVLAIATATGAVWYFRFGDLNWHATPDWIKDWTYNQALHESLRDGRLPWFLTDPFQGTNRYFANPETNVAPHALLLGVIDVETFLIAQCVAFLLAGLAACHYLARDLRLGPVASLTFVAMWLMNGHLIGHLHTGHTQWVGYLLFPCVFLFLHRAALGDLGGRTQAGLALAVATIALVGGFHLFVWCVIFTGVFVALDRSRWRFGVSALALLIGLTALRLVPAVTLYASPDTEFVGSYQQLSLLTRALVGEIRTKIDGLGWWEYDVYVGWAGFVIVLAGLTAPLGAVWRQSVASLWPSSIVLAALSMFNVYRWTLHPLPGFESQRVASRLLILGLLGFILIGCVQLNAWLDRRRTSNAHMAALGLVLLLLTTQLLVHTNGRRPTSDTGLGPPAVGVVISQQPEPVYAGAVAAGALVSAISLVMAVRLWRQPASAGP